MTSYSPLSVRTDTVAMFVARQLNAAYADAARSSERIATGLRINRAADDPTGLAISESLRSQINGASIGVRNAKDAVATVRVADDSLATTQKLLQDLRDVAVRANGGAPGADGELGEQMAQLLTSLDYVAKSTQLAGRPMLDGTYSGMFQVGANVADILKVAITLDASAKGLGLAGLSLGAQMTATTSVGRADVAAVPGTPSTFTLAAATDADVAALVGALTSPATDVTVGGQVVDLSGVSTVSELQSALGSTPGVAVARTATGFTLTAATNGPSAVVTGLAGTSSAGTADQPPVLGVGASVTGKLDLDQLAGEITFNGSTSLNLASIALAGGTATQKADALKAALETKFTGSTATVGADGTFTLTAAAHNTTDAFTVRTDAGSLALESIDKALASVSTARAGLGASERTIGFASNIAQATVTNLSDARNRIVKADVVEETAALSRSQILAEAAASMLAQTTDMRRDMVATLLR